MTTNFVTDMDSPIYAGEKNLKNFWTESEMTLSKSINTSYDGTIVVDLHGLTGFKKGTLRYYQLTPEGDIDWDYMSNILVIWKKKSLTRPVQVSGSVAILLGDKFKIYLDENFSCMYDVGEVRAYLREGASR